MKSRTSNTVCPTCKGNGWILYTPHKDLFRDVYGDTDLVPNDYAKPCPDCHGMKGRYSAAHEKDLTGVPEMFRFADISKFKFDIYNTDTTKLEKIAHSFVTDFDKWKAECRGLYIWSAIPGSGKSFLSACLGKSIMTSRGITFRFITVPDYIASVGDSYKREKGESDQSEIYRSCDLLVLDDIGANMSRSEWQAQELFRIVDERMRKGKPTIYTSNYPLTKLGVDERVKSRISSTSVTIQLPEESIREKLSQANRESFLQRVL